MSDNLVARRADLSSTKRALLERWKRGTPASENTSGSIRKRQQHSPAPVSLEQQRLWFLDQFAPESALYNMAMALYLSGPLEVKILERCIAELLKRHEILRTHFVAVHGKPLQSILPADTLPYPISSCFDVQGLTPAGRAEQVRRLVSEEAKSVFDLANALPIRVSVLKVAASEYVLLITMHHIVSDGWSIGIFYRELAALYTAFTQSQEVFLAPLPIQYADYALWQQAELQSPVFAEQLHYWRNHLANVPTLLFPTDYPRSAVLTTRGAQQSFSIPEALVQRLKALQQREGVTFFVTLLTAFALVLRRYTGQDDVVIGTPAAQRTYLELEGLIGCFINTLVLRLDLSGRPNVQQLLQRVRDVTLHAFANQGVPFEKLVEELQPQRDMSRPPLCQVLFQFQNTHWETFQLPGVKVQRFEALNEHARFDLELNLTETATTLVGHLVYNRDLFVPETMQRLIDHYVLQLESLVSTIDQPLLTKSQLPAPEWQKLLVDWNATSVRYPEQACIHELVAEQVNRTPDAIALQHNEQQLSYAELFRRSRQLADHLQAQGLGPNQLVGLYIERSPLLLIGLLAILQTGAAYVPLDPAYPRERLTFMLEDAQVSLIVTEQALLSSLPKTQIPHICINQLKQWKPANVPPLVNISAQLAYVIYTSGSTGTPKGVQVPHQGVVNFLLDMQRMLALQAHEHVLGLTTLSFDIAVLELFLPLLTGARLLLLDRSVAQDGPQLSTIIEQMQITLAQATPATWRLLLGANWTGSSTLRILCGGEALSRDLAQALFIRGKELWNLYGPTETTVWSTAMLVQETNTTISIGRPLANTQIYLLDSNGVPVPQGAVGELFIGGAGVVRGYIRQPALTAERFLPDEFSGVAGARLYRTGDLARYQADGSLEYLGRADQQVKLRGYRIEPGEIEHVLVCHPQIRQAVVIIHTFAAADQRLLAYVVAVEANLPPSPEALQTYLQARLPQYMIPSLFIPLEEIPLTPNGKVNRRALPSPDEVQHVIVRESTPLLETPTEELLLQLCSQVLGRPVLSSQDNFFALGGHSLLAAQLISRLRELFQIELPLRSLFENPTLAQLARVIEQEQQQRTGTVLPQLQPVAYAEGEPLPLSFAQQRLWFVEQLQPESTSYTIAGAFKLSGQIEIAALEYALRKVIERHETLHVRFTEVQGEPVQVRIPVSDVSAHVLTVIDLRSLADPLVERCAQHLAHTEALRPFQLASGELLRVTLLCLTDTVAVLVLTMHHIVSDAWSIGVLLQELGKFYNSYRHQSSAAPGSLPLQYHDFAHWQRRWLTGAVLDKLVRHWQQRLQGSMPLQLPTDFRRTELTTSRGALKTFLYPAEFVVRLKTLGQQAGVTTFMLLTAAFQVLLARISGQDDIIIGIDSAQRTHETAGLIGLFVNQLALRTDLSGQPTFEEVVKRVRDVILDAYAHQDLPFEKVVEAVNPQRVLDHAPLFQVKLSFTSIEEQSLLLSGLTVQPFSFDVQGALTKFDMTLYLRENAHGLHGTLVYNAALFEESSILRLLAQFHALLDNILVHPERRITELLLQAPEERTELLEHFNDDLEIVG